MASISWKAAASGNWKSAADWSSGVPTITDDVTIAVAGAYTATISDAESARSVTLNAGGATLSDTGTLTLGTALTLTSGSFVLGSGGVVSGGTIAMNGGAFVASNGTLSGVTYQGTLDLSPSNARVQITGSLTLTGAGGTGVGAVQLTGSNSDLILLNSMTLDKATIDIGNNSGWSYLELAGTADTLTLGPALNLVQTGTYAQLYNDSATNAIVNEGTINASIAGGQFVVFGNQHGIFTNQGSISVSNNDLFNLTNASFGNAGVVTINGGSLSLAIWSNSGTISMSAGSLTLGNSSSGEWNNTGKIAVTGGTLTLGGSFTAAQLRAVAITAGTVVNLTGALADAGTLTVGAGTSLGTVAFTGRITGGVIADAGGGGLVSNYGTLSGVTYQGTLDLTGANARVDITGSLILAGAGGTGSGSVQITGYNSDLILFNSMTLTKATIDIGNSGTWRLCCTGQRATAVRPSRFIVMEGGRIPDARVRASGSAH